MKECKYCTNYHLNSKESIDNSCLGVNDCRSSYFYCNDDLKPNKKKKDLKKTSVQEMIRELEKRGYTIIKP